MLDLLLVLLLLHTMFAPLFDTSLHLGLLLVL